MGIMELELMVKKDLEYYEQEIWHGEGGPELTTTTSSGQLPVMYYFPCQFVSIASDLLV